MNCQQKGCVSSSRINYIQDMHNNTSSSDYVFDINDRTTLISNYPLKNKQINCQCFISYNKQSNMFSSQPWITFIHILSSAALAILSIFLTSDILIFETKSTVKEIDDILWRFPSDQPELYESSTQSVNPSTKKLPTSKDKCEPLYVLVYAHCFVWFLFLIIDHIGKHIHNKILRSRGHLRAYARLNRLAAIPFQLASLWTVLLAIFIVIYAQKDESDMQQYCDANMLMSPKNGIALLLILEFIFITISSLWYANSIRKFNLEKPPPDVCGWEDNGYYNRWTPQVLQDNDSDNNTRIQDTNSERILNYEHQNERCLLDLLEYYAHINRELVANLGQASQKLHQLEVENQTVQPSQSEPII